MSSIMSSPPSYSSSSLPHSSYKNEIIQSFQVFDEERTGTISVNNLKLIIRALGFRVTKHDVLRDVLESNQRRGFQRENLIKNFSHRNDDDGNVDDDDANNDAFMKEIDLETVLDVMLNPNSKYNRNNQNEDEIKLMHKINFRLFDVENKGYITASNLKRVIEDLKGLSREMEIEGSHAFDDIDDEELRAMIEEFDGDQDGMISEDEFRRIMEHM
eukprot:283147_1